jgi:hypothetical protein
VDWLENDEEVIGAFFDLSALVAMAAVLDVEGMEAVSRR